MNESDLFALRGALLGHARRLVYEYGHQVVGGAEGLLDDALGKLYEYVKGHPDVKVEQPTHYVRRIMKHQLLDQIRQQSSSISLDAIPHGREPTTLDEESPDRLPEDRRRAAWIEFQELTRERRRALDGLLDSGSGKVSRKAVLLLELRLALLRRISAHLWRDYELPQLKRLAEESLPWHLEEEEMKLRKNWSPSLLDLWDALAEQMLAGAHWGVDVIVEVVNAQLAEDQRVNRVTWDAWKLRGKKNARDEIGQETWNRLFADLLPDNRRPRGGRGR